MSRDRLFVNNTKMRDHELLNDKKVFDWETEQSEETKKAINDRMGYAIEDGRIDQLDALEMTLQQRKEWLDKYDNGYDPY